ncbi:MAG: LuxR C-terminal-related transcriptional regulator [Snowella sp.]|nr:LuxR C-terminal-related transcriptional regulator [Snowella sp.]
MDLRNLSEPELQILTCLSDGMTTDEIALALNKSDRTIDNQVMALRKKTGNDSRIKLLADYFKSITNPNILEQEITSLETQASEYEAKATIYRQRIEAKKAQLTLIKERRLNA